ncbi:MAG: queuosine precursor transporter [Acidimicrobiia bacterium]|nr:queuosine precursor transporter [Acidimicrobiia bacterium]NNF08711.1 queuosine precursor transporter [Acidimicrobiia bacterium]NNL70306.1 queuosine precursor transporter [Acidimicrobiia bacterium]
MTSVRPRLSPPVVIAILAGAYVAAQMMADIASLKIIVIFDRAVDAGTLVYPFTFTLRDMVHKLAGRTVARALIFSAAAINLAMAALFWIVSEWSGDPGAGDQMAFGDVLAPVWRIVLASIIAEVVAELIDTEAYQKWVDRFGNRLQWGRVLSSNLVAVPVDSALFVLIAFVGDLPGSVIWEVFWLNVIFKVSVTIISLPWIYAVRDPALDSTATGEH